MHRVLHSNTCLYSDASLFVHLYAFHLQECLDCKGQCIPFYCITALHIIANNACVTCWHSIYYGDAQLASEWSHGLGYTIPYLISTAGFTLALYADIPYTMETRSWQQSGSTSWATPSHTSSMLPISFWIWPQETFPPRRSQEQILGCISSTAQRGSSL